ncbi:MAG: indole-3-glycerol phosphate synthase TrpC [Candidatus Methylacidiphilales bacterium]|nr:indole-3-glycerol phosphate synthase TrpC [Candidatus Methylacidiphilales bacterium]
MSTFHNKLAEILATKRDEAARLEPLAAELRKAALKRNDFRGFRRVLFQPGAATLIAEIKKASPSVGVITDDFNPVQQAREYIHAGAHALSVLTDEKYFQGNLGYLQDIRDQVDVPLLRKDFMLTVPQIYESVIAGADAVLLIVAALEDDQLARLYHTAHDLQLDVLVEVHNLAEMDRAVDLGADIIGINNRNLKTFEVNLAATEDLAPEIPADVLGITESGIKTPADVDYCRGQGIDCFLIGETLMRSANVKQTVEELFGEGLHRP